MKRLLCLLALALLIPSSVLRAQDSATSATNATETPLLSAESSDVLGPDQLRSKLSEIQGDPDLSENARTNAVQRLQAAILRVETAQQHRAKASNFSQSITNAVQTAAGIRDQLEQLSGRSSTNLLQGVAEESTSREIEQLAAQARANIIDLRARSADINSQIQALNNRANGGIANERAQASQRLSEIQELLAENPPQNESVEETEAFLLLQQARRLARQNEINMLDQESVSANVRRDLLETQADLLSARIAHDEDRARALESEANRRRQTEAQQAAAEVREEYIGIVERFPILQQQAEEIAELTRKLGEVANRLTSVQNVKTQVENQLGEVTNDYSHYEALLERTKEVHPAFARILMDKKSKLPDVQQLAGENQRMQGLITSATTNSLFISERLRSNSPVSGVVTNIVDSADMSQFPGETEQTLYDEANKMVAKKVEILEELDSDYNSLLDDLGGVLTSRNELIEAIRFYKTFLNSKLLWVQSIPAVGKETMVDFLNSLEWFVSADNWFNLASAFFSLGTIYLVLIAIAIVALVALQLARWKMIAKLEPISIAIRKVSKDHFRYTAEVALITVALVLPLPLLLLVISRGLLASAKTLSESGSISFTVFVAWGMFFFGCVYAGMQLIREVCRPKGLASAHFRWKEETVKFLRINLLWLMWVVCIAGFFVIGLAESSETQFSNSLGRIAYIVQMVACAIFIRKLLHPNKGLVQSAIHEHPSSWYYRFRWIWYPLAVLAPLALAVIAALGYYYAAVELGLRLIETGGFIAALILLYNFGIRWFYIKQRRLALERAVERRKASASEKTDEKTEGELSVSEELKIAAEEESKVDLDDVHEQTQKLMRSLTGLIAFLGIWLIWATELPALNFLNNIELWQYTVGEGEDMIQKSITLFHIVLCVFVVVITTIASKNLPGVLEIAVLQNLPIDSGSRYAISTTSQYALVTIGFIVIFQILAVDWSQFGWVFAALSVGLGFGLQEIVANFVCGILIFIERPIRVGDIVTVADIDGIVSRIRIRATTITNWDRKEFIVPNKEFITGRILNWTLSNPINRFVVNVGVAYGSDTDRARKLLFEILDGIPEIMKDPAPLVNFEGFGDSTLNFVVRCYLPNLEKRLVTIHEVHTAIHKRFMEEGIEIAFPQVDLHVRDFAPKVKIDYEKLADAKVENGAANGKAKESDKSENKDG